METKNLPKKPPSRVQEWLKDSQQWAANATLPLMLHLSRASHLVTQKMEGEIKVSTSQVRILFEALNPEGVTQSFLGKRHNVDPASITRTVQQWNGTG